MLLNYMISAGIGYLLGTANLAYFISKAKNIDLRSYGSGNLGASNATYVMGKTIGILVLLHDALKALLAIVICTYLFPTLKYSKYVAGIGSVLGHLYPYYLKFKGGKGFASYVGTLLGLDFKFALQMIVVIVVVSIITDWIVAGTLSTIAISPIYFGITQGIIPFGILLIGSICMFPKHIENIQRKMNGTEIRMLHTLLEKRQQSRDF